MGTPLRNSNAPRKPSSESGDHGGSGDGDGDSRGACGNGECDGSDGDGSGINFKQ